MKNKIGIDIRIVDIDVETELAEQFKVKGIPALLVDNELITTNENIRPYLSKEILK